MSAAEKIMAALSDAAKEEFKKASSGMKLADLASGEYVSKAKADAEIKTERDKAEALQKQLDTAQGDIAKAGAAEKLVTELQGKIKTLDEDHKKELAALERTAAHEKKRTSVLSDLAKAGAHDPDLAFQALGLDLDKVDFDDSGRIAGVEDKIKAQQKEKTFLYQTGSSRNTFMDTTKGGAATPQEQVDAALTAIGRGPKPR
ncbi:MAG: phage scaffolding protein [Desulfovibrionaceae bacterium]|nr:phage scaffolding protein [Desulfovibrionaceae bacterium]